jgi:ribosomal protein S12 methylthiotransferase accessory factor
VAADRGISRVTDITRLDRAGVPVFTSIRPAGRALCVNAGKGLRPIEAQVGAYMEAIEFALAEYGGSSLDFELATARDVLDGDTRDTAILDLCPTVGARIDLDAPLACVEAVSVLDGRRLLVPAQLVFQPFPSVIPGERYFASSSNGLSSGNSVLEATIHGIAEVIERDIASFHVFRDSSALIAPDTYPEVLRPVQASLAEVGLALYLRYSPSEFGLAFFAATVADAEMPDPVHVYGGQACHPSSEIAAVRAVCEALQSRLSFIHGGRDDLADRYEKFSDWSPERRLAYGEQLVSQVARSDEQIAFADVPDYSEQLSGLEAAFDVLVAALGRANLTTICRVAYTEPDEHLQVVRIIVPGLEHFSETAPRMGIRLREHVAAVA